ncbi:MOSC domain-containing protein [Hyphobacterium marinum]|uniref:MOSC domain-containing protein n=1 Tax=Hyphobacterium marinum TaxID=3116574 RepID=A0ABU7LXE9_9PROT|nr:MOSC domain-containing protein [Hyphobacterium sp. Y6023]MEE2566227.1 MOSC domain-containing protein [Hyphobacterium sp. Y6023]
MTGRVAALARHPVKGFTPEPLTSVALTAGAHFPGDRLYAVEDGPCGFDPETPEHIKKTAFTVLARLPQVAAVRTRWNEDEGTLTAWHADFGEITADLDGEAGRSVFATWLSAVLGDAVRGPLKVLSAPDGFRFMDSPKGFVSIINLESVRDLEAKTGRAVDPARFRGNVMVEGWPAWSELDLADRDLTLGGARLTGIKPITRCAATHVDPHSAERDIDLVRALFDHYGHMDCGLYCRVDAGGPVMVGDDARLA